MIIIRQDIVWGPGIKVLTEDVQIAAGAKLTIKPGTEIHGNGHNITVYGQLAASGELNNTIYIGNTHIGGAVIGTPYDRSIDINYAQIDGGSVNGYRPGDAGSINLKNSILTKVKGKVELNSGSEALSHISNNIFLDSAGVSIELFATSKVDHNIFDRYGLIIDNFGGQHQNAAISSSGSLDEVNPISFRNAFLEENAIALELSSGYGGLTSKEDYFGNSDLKQIENMLYDKRSNAGIYQEIIINNPTKTPNKELTKSMFSFTSVALPREIIVDARLFGGANANLTGNKLDNKLIGNVGNNTIDGGLGADTMIGGAGNDTYVVDNVRDVILENAGKGTDRVVASVSYTLANNVEMLTLSGTKAINATGNGLANHLVGNGAANALDGKGGADTMEGGAGNDVYFVDHASDRVVEAVGEGRDTVVTTVSYRLTADQQIEILQTADANGTAALKLTGNAFGNKLVGNAGNNVLDGGAGIDEMRGGAGNDTYVVDHARDVVVEAVRGGTDTVLSFVSYALKAGQEIESLRLTGTAGSANLTGNEFGQSLTGNVGANVLDGGLGADVLTGGKGADTFVFSTKLGADNVDRITDFTGADTIRLSKSIFSALAPGELKAGEFKDIAKAKVDVDDHILYDSRDGSLFYDADGSGKAAAVKFAVLDNKAAITHADFLIA